MEHLQGNLVQTKSGKNKSEKKKTNLFIHLCYLNDIYISIMSVHLECIYVKFQAYIQIHSDNS